MSVYQPIVELEHGTVVAVEALARGPEGPYHTPDVLFASAATEGVAVPLDWACRAAALRGALAAGLPREVTPFVNVESFHLGTEAPASVRRLGTRPRRGCT